MLKLIGALALLAVAGWATWRFGRPLLPDPKASHRRPPPAPKAAGLPPEVLARIDVAGDLDVAEHLAAAGRNYTSDAAAAQVRELTAVRGERARIALADQVETLLNSFRYRSAAELAQRFRDRWAFAPVAAEMSRILEGIRAEEEEQVAARRKQALALLDEGRFEAARDALHTAWELEEPYRARITEALAELIDRPPTTIERPPGGEPEPARIPTDPRAEPSAVAPLPAGPDLEVRRLGEARALLQRARDLYSSGKHDPAARALKELLDSHGDMQYVRRRAEGIEALRMLARHGVEGTLGLLRAREAARAGDKVRLRYDFQGEQLLDWEQLPTIPHGDKGSFEPARDGIRGDGVMTFLLRAFFENDVTIRCRSHPTRLKTHGLAFCQAGEETRQILLLATNHWFVEGENYVKERPGHSLIMIGKGTNADVPVDSPDIGFIFRVTRDSPEVSEGDDLQLAFTLRGSTMESDVECNGKSTTMRGEARGDDGRGIERLRPALFVLQNNVIFREVAIEGRLHPHFERERVAELLAIVEAMP